MCRNDNMNTRFDNWNATAPATFPAIMNRCGMRDCLNCWMVRGRSYPGIELILVDGHTPGQQTVKVFAGEQAIWMPADLVPMASHVPLPYIMGYDLFPVTTLEGRRSCCRRRPTSTGPWFSNMIPVLPSAA